MLLAAPGYPEGVAGIYHVCSRYIFNGIWHASLYFSREPGNNRAGGWWVGDGEVQESDPGSLGSPKRWDTKGLENKFNISVDHPGKN